MTSVVALGDKRRVRAMAVAPLSSAPFPDCHLSPYSLRMAWVQSGRALPPVEPPPPPAHRHLAGLLLKVTASLPFSGVYGLPGNPAVASDLSQQPANSPRPGSEQGQKRAEQPLLGEKVRAREWRKAREGSQGWLCSNYHVYCLHRAPSILRLPWLHKSALY